MRSHPCCLRCCSWAGTKHVPGAEQRGQESCVRGEAAQQQEAKAPVILAGKDAAEVDTSNMLLPLSICNRET